MTNQNSEFPPNQEPKEMKEPGYWAAQSTEKIGDNLKEKIDSYYKYLTSKMFMAQWLKTYLMYYGGKGNVGSIYKGGEQGELSNINVNNLKSIIQSLITITVDERPTWEAMGINSDVKTQKQTILATGLLDFTMREKRVERDLIKAVEFACLFGEGFVSVEWDTNSGTTLSYDDNEHPIKIGDITFASHEPIDVIRDVKLEEYRSRDWLIVRKYENKWNLSAKYPKFSSVIETLQAPNKDYRYHYRYREAFLWTTDVVPTYHFFHSKTPACPRGRYTIMLEDGSVIVDTPLPYRHITVGRIASSDLIGSPFGYPQAYDLTAIQENVDMLYSTILTNQEAFGITNIIAPLGAGLNYTQIPGQLNYLEYNAQAGPAPHALELLKTPPELGEMITKLEQKQIELSGLNDVARGNTPSADMSGAALALLDAKAIKLNQLLQWSYTGVLEDLGTWTIEIWQDYAKDPRVATIVGTNNRSKVIEFTGEDLAGIDRVIVQSGNPLSKTVSGKLQIAQMLLQAGVVKMPDEIMQLINTGRLEPMTEGKTNQLLLIKEENEMLSDGKMCPVIRTDDHVLHINEHASVLADPAVRLDPEIANAALSHIEQHIQQLQDPNNTALLQMLHQPPLPPQQAGAPQQAQGAAPTQPGTNSNAMSLANQPNLPNAPTNPATGEKAPMPNGAAINH